MKMTNISIKASGVSKKYKLYNSSKDRLLDLVSPKSFGEEFFALNNVDFIAEKGDIVGFVGINGSGKSTFSNILAGIVPATEGEVFLNGDVSLIAVAAGLKGDLTGRENIELKCLMLGFTQKEIKELEPKIIKFSELGAFIDQPVKSYSSGMKSRLGFAISVNVDPDILIIDEALSVGDKSFAEKSLNKMKEFKEAGKTMIFVSHSLGQMRQFCEKILWLEFGEVKAYGLVNEVLPMYEEFLNRWKEMSEEEKELYKMYRSKQEVQKAEELIEISSEEEKNEIVPISRMCKFKELSEVTVYLNPLESSDHFIMKSFPDKSYYIKKIMKMGSNRFYLLSDLPSSEHGVLGWVNMDCVVSYLHMLIDEDLKELRLKGKGIGYNQPWGGKENVVISDLSNLANQIFTVKRTDKLGKNIWYFGSVNDKEIWLHEAHVYDGLI